MGVLKSIHDPEVQAVLSEWPSSKEYHKSPDAWEDQVMYFLLPDRFSDGNERGYKDSRNVLITSGTTPPFEPADAGNAIGSSDDKDHWVEAGSKFVGGTLKGATSKLGYLRRMGVSAIWIGPVFKQIAKLETYHGYGVQDFLEVDKRFGTKEDLRELVRAAHDAGIYVILDVIVNHCGNVFAYKDGDVHYTPSPHQVKGFWSADRMPDHILPLGPVDESDRPDAYPDGAIWPTELQDQSNFARKGYISDWDAMPESVEGDIFDLKSFDLGPSDVSKFVPSKALITMCEIYKFWIAFADFDGFRIDTVKHMGDGPTSYFASTIHDFAQSLGKDNFFLVGEISNDRAREVVLATGLDAALGIGTLQRALNQVPRSQAPPSDYFGAFNNVRTDAERWARDQVVTMIDDHDQLWKWWVKDRFCANRDGTLLIGAALVLNLCSLGIPCVYYGTEQNFDGTSKGSPDREEQYVREAMFGGSFGAFRSRNRHFFDENSPTYSIIRDITDLRAKEVALRRGDQYLCTVSPASIFTRLDGLTNAASYRRFKSVVAWLRVERQDRMLCAINTSADGPARAWATMNEEDCGPFRKGVMRCLYPDGGPQNLKVVRSRQGSARVLLSLPSAGFVIYKFFGIEEQMMSTTGSFARANI